MNLQILLIFIFFMNTFTNKLISKEKLLITDKKILEIPIVENNEPLIDLKETGDIKFGTSPEIPDNKCYTKMRKSVYERLLKVNEFLKDYGVEICLYEALRDLELQQYLFSSIYNRIKESNSEMTHEEIFLESTKGVSPVINLDGTKNVPPHSTGGAVDVYLVYIETGDDVDMGSHPRDPFIENISCTDSNDINEEAQKWRNLMSRAMISAGFVNYFTEYWHWSYGDRYWAYYSEKQSAIYTSI